VDLSSPTCRRTCWDREFPLSFAPVHAMHDGRATLQYSIVSRERGFTLLFPLYGNRLLMGVLSPIQSSVVFPWFRADHRLQRNVPLQLGLKVGLCGCLTTCKYIPLLENTIHSRCGVSGFVRVFVEHPNDRHDGRHCHCVATANWSSAYRIHYWYHVLHCELHLWPVSPQVLSAPNCTSDAPGKAEVYGSFLGIVIQWWNSRANVGEYRHN
jgi:hypothetical protein